MKCSRGIKGSGIKGSGIDSDSTFLSPLWSVGRFRSADRSKCRDQAQALSGLDLPCRVAERLTALDRAPERVLLRGTHGGIDAPGPAGRPLDRPRAQGRTLPRLPGGVSPEAAPPALFGPFNQPRAKRVAFDIPADRQEMAVILNRKRFETTLVDVSRARGMAMGMPPLRVGHGEPAHEL